MRSKVGVADSREKPSANSTDQRPGRKAMLVLAFLFALTAISVSVGLLVYTAWRQDLKDGLFALAFAVLSARAALSLILWHDSDQKKPGS